MQPTYLDLGSANPQQELQGEVQVHNWTDKPVRLIGGTSDCSCIVTEGLPLTIPPGEARTLPIHLIVKTTESGLFTRMAQLWTDCDQQRVVWLRLGCKVN